MLDIIYCVLDLEHWITSCEATEDQIKELFGPVDFNRLDSLTKYPTEAIVLARDTLDGAYQDAC